MTSPTYLFLDESGDLGFNPRGSDFYVLTRIRTQRPFHWRDALDNYKYDLIEFGLNHEHFHCAEDNSHVRNRVFDIIQNNLDEIQIDSVIVEKNKTHPKVQQEMRFYIDMLNTLLGYVLNREGWVATEEVIVITDRIPINRKRKAIEKGIKTSLPRLLPRGVRGRILHHDSRSHYGLQVADYCSWAIYRKWQNGKTDYYDRVKPALHSEYDIFERGRTIYY